MLAGTADGSRCAQPSQNNCSNLILRRKSIAIRSSGESHHEYPEDPPPIQYERSKG